MKITPLGSPAVYEALEGNLTVRNKINIDYTEQVEETRKEKLAMKHSKWKPIGLAILFGL